MWEAVTSWYDAVYIPVVSLIRAEKILERFPKRTETDLYLWIMDHLHELQQRYGDEVDAPDAVEDFVEHHARQSILHAIRRRLLSVREGRPATRKPDQNERITDPSLSKETSTL